jgi:hypothetical protein
MPLEQLAPDGLIACGNLPEKTTDFFRIGSRHVYLSAP